jgi:hypothetical protein
MTIVFTPSPRGEGAGGGVNHRPFRISTQRCAANLRASSFTPPPTPSPKGEGEEFLL